MKTLLVIVLALVSACGFSACSNSSSPSTSTPKTASLTMQNLVNLPSAGGDVTGVAFLDDATLVAVIDNAIATIPTAGGAPTVRYNNAAFQTVVVGGSGEIYAMTADNLWVLDNINTTPRKSTVFNRSSFTLNVMLNIGPNGQPYLRVLSYPSVMELWTSTDRGTTWTKLTIPTAAEYGGGLAFGPNGEMYLSSPSSFYASADSGRTWKKYPPVVANYGGELLRRKNGDILYYIPTGGGLWSSNNKGASFTNCTPFNSYPFYSKIMEGADGNLYALLTKSATTQTDKPFRFMMSTDGGKTWKHVLFAQGHDFDLRGGAVAIGLGSAGCGGVALSHDGTTFQSIGLRSVQNINSFGFDKTGNVILSADGGLFVQNGSGWKTWGALGNARIATTPQGNIYIPAAGVFSNTNGSTWTELTMPKYTYSGIGEMSFPVVLGLRSGEAMVSLTTFRRDLVPNVHTNGALYRIQSDGTVQTIVGNGNYTQMIQDGSGKLWASTENFSSSRQSTDNGLTWVEGTPARPGFAFDSQSRFIAYGSGFSFNCGKIGNTATTSLTLNGFTSTSNLITESHFDQNDHLFLLTADKGLFSSTGTLP